MSAENTSSEIQDQHSTEPFSLKNSDDFLLSNEDNQNVLEERPVDEMIKATITSTSMKDYESCKAAHTESVPTINTALLTDRKDENEEDTEVMPTSQFREKILSTSGASISRICESDEDGKLDVLPCEQQFLPLLVIVAFSQFVRVLDILMSMIEQECRGWFHIVTKEYAADHDKMFCQK